MRNTLIGAALAAVLVVLLVRRGAAFGTRPAVGGVDTKLTSAEIVKALRAPISSASRRSEAGCSSAARSKSFRKRLVAMAVHRKLVRHRAQGSAPASGLEDPALPAR